MFLGILFNLDELGGAYGLAAYKLLFEAVSPNYFYGCYLSDGDIGERFCVGLECANAKQLFQIEARIARSEAQGFADSNSRFTFDEQVANYLAPAGYINHQGELERTENPWLQNAWERRHRQPDREPRVTDFDTDSPSTLIATKPPPPPSVFIPSDEYAPGDLIGSDYVVHYVRKGGMGIVYIVEDLPSRRQKIQLRLALKTFQSRYLWNDEATARFEREALVWIELGKHPQVVHAMLVQRVINRPFLWLEFVDGESLAERLTKKRVTIGEALNFALQFCHGMRHAHENHGVIHRDIKPANILLDKDCVLKITDFGLSRLQAQLAGEVCEREGGQMNADELATVTGAFVTAAGQCMGTPAYIAPEAIVAPQTVDTRTDIYSFGIVLYEMLAGERPFHGANILRQQLDSVPTPLTIKNPRISTELGLLVARCLEKNPRDRFHSFRELETALRQVPESAAQSEMSGQEVSIPLTGQWFMKGFTFMELGKHEDAITCFHEVITLDDTQHEAFNNLGVCLAHLGRTDEALEAIEKAVALKPDYGEAWSNLGGIYERQQRYDDGIQACNRAITLKPQWAEAYSNLGGNLWGKGRLDEAASAFRRAITEDESYWLAYLRLAQMSAETGSPEQALTLLSKAIEINPREPDLLASMAACLIDLNRTEEAAKYVDLALRANSQHPLATRVQASFREG